MNELLLTQAAVVDEIGGTFSLREIEVSELRADEVLIDIVAVGLCHTDLAVRDGHLPFPLPGVLGHEGSGIVRAVGSQVTRVAAGDRVCVSFNSCGECKSCLENAPSYCDRFMELNFGGTNSDGSPILSESDTGIGGGFFGQSTFAGIAKAYERNVVRVPEGVPLELAGPLGCGIQTGAGAVMRALDCKAGSSLLVTGGGSVGLAGVLAAKVRGLSQIIVADPIEERRKLALELGATHALDPMEAPIDAQVREILPDGVDAVLDTTAIEKVLTESIAALARRGKLGMVGVPSDPVRESKFGLLDVQSRGISLIGIVEGNADPQEFISELMDLYIAGQFPFDRLISLMPFEQINEAIEKQANGEAVKVVLQMK